MPLLQTQVFDLGNDPAELHNVAAAHADIVEKLSAQIDEQLAREGRAIRE
jgi:hypothetical protein